MCARHALKNKGIADRTHSKCKKYAGVAGAEALSY